MNPAEQTDAPTVRKMKSDRERDGKRRPAAKARTRKLRAERARKRAQQAR